MTVLALPEGLTPTRELTAEELKKFSLSDDKAFGTVAKQFMELVPDLTKQKGSVSMPASGRCPASQPVELIGRCFTRAGAEEYRQTRKALYGHLVQFEKAILTKQEVTSIQSLIFSKEQFKTEAAAKQWAKDHGFKFGKVDETSTSFRLRQFEPDVCKRIRTGDEIDAGVVPLFCVRDVAKRGLPAPDPEAGVHAHGLDRQAGMTVNDGKHPHIVFTEEGIFRSEEDGEHPHVIPEQAMGLDADRTAVTGPHRHRFIHPETGEEFWSEVGGEHAHDLLVLVSAFDGVHRHRVIFKGIEYWTSMASDFVARVPAVLESKPIVVGPASEVLKQKIPDVRLVDPPTLTKLTNDQLLELDTKLHADFQKNFAGNDKTQVMALSREDVINAHIFLIEELGRRRLAHPASTSNDALSQEGRGFAKKRPAKKYVEGEPIRLTEILQPAQGFTVIKDFLSLTGSVVRDDQTKQQVDLLMKKIQTDLLEEIVTAKLGGQLPVEIQSRINLMKSDELLGPFIDHVPFADLQVVIKPEFQRKLMRLVDQLTKQVDPLQTMPVVSGPVKAVLKSVKAEAASWDLSFELDDKFLNWNLDRSRTYTNKQADFMAGKAPMTAKPKLLNELSDSDDPSENFEVEYGLQKQLSHEYFLSGKTLKGILQIRRMPSLDGDSTVWKAQILDTLLPEVVSSQEASMPPDGKSGLPVSLEKQVPPGLRYWEQKDATARRVRDELVQLKFFTEDNIKLVNGRLTRTVQKRWVSGYPFDPEVEKSFVETQYILSQKGEEFFLVLANEPHGAGTWVSKTSPISADSTDMVFKDLSKEISDLTILEEGSVRILSKHANQVQYQFVGDKLRGLYTMSKSGEVSWTLSKIQDIIQATPAKKTQLVLLESAPGMDPRDSYGLNRFSDLDETVKKFAQPFLKSGIFVEPEIDGLRCMVHKKGDQVRLFLEGSHDDSSKVMPNVSKALLEINHDFVLDAHLLDFDQAGKPLTKKSLSRLIGTAKAQEDAGIKLMVSDVLFWDESQVQKTLVDRKKLLTEKVFETKRKHLEVIPSLMVQDESKLREVSQTFLQTEGSVGTMYKVADSPYNLDGITSSWATLRVVRTVKAIILEQHPVRGSTDTFNYSAAIGPLTDDQKQLYKDQVLLDGKTYTAIGKTGNTKIKVKPGQVVLVEAMEFLVEKQKDGMIQVGWFMPRIVQSTLDQKAPDSVDKVVPMAKAFEINKLYRHVDLYRDVLQKKLQVFPDGSEHYVLGVMLEPEKVDLQNEIYSAAEVKGAAFHFLDVHRNIGYMHKELVNDKVSLVESYVAPVDMKIGGQMVKKGTWLIGLIIKDAELWRQVESGELTGFSIGGSAFRIPERLAA